MSRLFQVSEKEAYLTEKKATILPLKTFLVAPEDVDTQEALNAGTPRDALSCPVKGT